MSLGWRKDLVRSHTAAHTPSWTQPWCWVQAGPLCTSREVRRWRPQPHGACGQCHPVGRAVLRTGVCPHHPATEGRACFSLVSPVRWDPLVTLLPWGMWQCHGHFWADQIHVLREFYTWSLNVAHGEAVVFHIKQYFTAYWMTLSLGDVFSPPRSSTWENLLWSLLYLSAQSSSVAQSCPTLCDPMDCSTPSLPVHHQLLESTQTHVHRVGDAIQPSHSLSSPSPPAFNLSQHQGLFKWVRSSQQVAKVLEFQLQCQDWSPLGWTGWISLQSKGLSRVFSNTTVQKHPFFGTQLSL